MNDIVSEYVQHCNDVIDEVRQDLKGIRTGRANSAMIEGIVVETYGGSTKLKIKELASITTEGSDTLIVTAFDPSTVEDINKALLTSDLGFTPKIDGSTLYIKVPMLTEEQRVKYSKIISQKAEDAKQFVRDIRNESRKTIKRMVDAKELSEEAQYRIEKNIDEETTKINTQLQDIRDTKQEEVMRV